MQKALKCTFSITLLVVKIRKLNKLYFPSFLPFQVALKIRGKTRTPATHETTSQELLLESPVNVKLYRGFLDGL